MNFGSSESSRSYARSGNYYSDLIYGASDDVIFGETNMLYVVPALLILFYFIWKK